MTVTPDEILRDSPLDGKHAIVTGATSGIGEETARALAAAGCCVTVTGRSDASAVKAADRIRQTGASGEIVARALELSDVSSVDRFAAGYQKGHDQLDILILNAGVMAAPLSRNDRGWEMHFATNHLGHHRLATSLLDSLRSVTDSRVVSLSSAAHLICGIDFDDPNFHERGYDPWLAYGQSKTANALFSVEFNRRHAAEGVTAYAVHPGMSETRIGRHVSASERAEVSAMAEAAGESLRSVKSAAATSVWAATQDDALANAGGYLADCAPADAAPHATDPRLAARLWDLSEGLVGG